jgi:transcriptional regulator with PAS, ATPase and Fis domain
MVIDGTFRADLFYRISPFNIVLPALRERKEDIAILAQSLLRRIVPNRELEFTESALEQLEAHDFKGNIRELRNMLERASLMTDGTKILAEHLINEVGMLSSESSQKKNGCGSCRVVQPLENIESKYLQCIMREHGEDLNYLSNALCVSKRTLYRMINKIKESNLPQESIRKHSDYLNKLD